MTIIKNKHFRLQTITRFDITTCEVKEANIAEGLAIEYNTAYDDEEPNYVVLCYVKPNHKIELISDFETRWINASNYFIYNSLRIAAMHLVDAMSDSENEGVYDDDNYWDC